MDAAWTTICHATPFLLRPCSSATPPVSQGREYLGKQLVTGALWGRWGQRQQHREAWLPGEHLYFSIAPSHPPLWSPELPESPRFFVMELLWQWQWDACSFSQAIALIWGLARFLFPFVLLCWINSRGWPQKFLAGKHYRSLPKKEPVPLVEGRGHFWGSHGFRGYVNTSIGCLGPTPCVSAGEW